MTPVRSPGWPPRPKELLKYEPSTVMLLSRLSWPTKEPPNAPPVYCGLRRAKSLMRSRTVGSVCSASRFTVVAAPVRAELKTSEVWAVTVTSSVRAAWPRVSSRSASTPRLTTTSFRVCGWKPLRVAVTV